MAWRSIGELAGNVMQSAEIAAAGSVEALNPRRGMKGPGAVKPPASADREASIGQKRPPIDMEPSPAPKDRPVMLRVVSAGMGMTRARNAPIRRPKGVARVSPMLVLVWDADRHAAASLQR